VGWISGRSELWYSAAGAAAWALHLRGREGGRPAASAAAWVLLAVSLGSKETAVAWPLLFLAGDLLFPPGGRLESGIAGRARRLAGSPAAKLYVGYAVVFLLWASARFLVLGQMGRRPEEGAHLLNPLEGLPWWPAVPFTFLRLLGIVVRLSIAPGGGCIDYGFNQIPLARGPMSWDVIAVLAGSIAALVGAIGVLRRESAGPGARLAVLGATFLILFWLPASSLLLASVSILAERNLYLPSFGVCLAAGALLDLAWRLKERWRTGLLAAVSLVVAAMGASSYARDAAFLDPVSLFGTASANCPYSARGHFLLGAVLMDRGLPERAARSYERALEIAPAYADARADLAQALSRSGRMEEARQEARRAASQAPARSIETRLASASALAAAGLPGEAERILEALRAGAPDDPRIVFIGAQILRAAGRLDEAEAAYASMKERFPGNPAGNDGVGAVLMTRGDEEGARRSFEEALAVDPFDSSALYNLGLIALMPGIGSDRGADEALGRFGRYVRVMPDDPLGWMRLGEAREKTGDLEGAERALRKAVGLAPGARVPGQALESFLARRHR